MNLYGVFCAHLLGDIQGKIPLTSVLIRKIQSKRRKTNGIQLCPGKKKIRQEVEEAAIIAAIKPTARRI